MSKLETLFLRHLATLLKRRREQPYLEEWQLYMLLEKEMSFSSFRNFCRKHNVEKAKIRPPEMDQYMYRGDEAAYKRRLKYYNNNPKVYVGRSLEKKRKQEELALQMVVQILERNPDFTYDDLKSHMTRMISKRGNIIHYREKRSKKGKLIKTYDYIYLPPEHTCFNSPEPKAIYFKEKWLDNHKPLVAAIIFTSRNKREAYFSIWSLSPDVAQATFYRWCKTNAL